MLARHIKAGGARVLQLGGSTRDLYYYPQVGGRRAAAGQGGAGRGGAGRMGRRWVSERQGGGDLRALWERLPRDEVIPCRCSVASHLWRLCIHCRGLSKSRWWRRT